MRPLLLFALLANTVWQHNKNSLCAKAQKQHRDRIWTIQSALLFIDVKKLRAKWLDYRAARCSGTHHHRVVTFLNTSHPAWLLTKDQRLIKSVSVLVSLPPAMLQVSFRYSDLGTYNDYKLEIFSKPQELCFDMCSLFSLWFWNMWHCFRCHVWYRGFILHEMLSQATTSQQCLWRSIIIQDKIIQRTIKKRLMFKVKVWGPSCQRLNVRVEHLQGLLLEVSWLVSENSVMA